MIAVIVCQEPLEATEENRRRLDTPIATAASLLIESLHILLTSQEIAIPIP